MFIFSFFGRRQQDSKIERNASKYRPMLMDIIKYVLFLVSSWDRKGEIGQKIVRRGREMDIHIVLATYFHF